MHCPARSTKALRQAERRLGELIREQRETVGLNEGGRPKKTGSDEEPVSTQPTLASQGVSKKLSARSQKLAAVPNAAFEDSLGERGKIQSAISGGSSTAPPVDNRLTAQPW